MMTASKGKARSVLAVAVFLTVLILGGCTTIKYSYDTGAPFPGLKTYTWAPAAGIYGGQDPSLEASVKDLADQTLSQKNFTRVAEKPDVFIFMTYEPGLRFKIFEPEIGYPQYTHQLRMLTLNTYIAERKEFVWRGTASGSIHTDAASGDLKQAVQGILSDFPPK